MSTALVMASVTSVLKDLLDNGLIQHDVTSSVGAVTVTALPPDRVPVGAEERSRLNIFMYRVTPDSRWRSRTTSAPTGPAENAGPPPLALNLHYLLTAYGEHDFDAEILLGYVIQLMHETPVLTPDAIQQALASPSPTDSASILPP